jgi:NAD(P)-dependent dehydrogenase (short-subunit alcohol dehydrogenase family)
VATVEGGENIVKTAVDNFGKVDILINNAGILRDKSLLKLEEMEWDLVLDVHLKGAFCVSKPAFKIMKENQFGRIINTTSGAGLYGNFGQANYASAKMGLIGLMHSLSVEGAKYNIKCNALAPVALSRLTEDIMPPEMKAKLQPEFVTPLVVYLVSEENQETNGIYNCGAGWYSKSAIVCDFGIKLGNGKPASVEDIRDSWPKINKIDEAEQLTTVNDTFPIMMK